MVDYCLVSPRIYHKVTSFQVNEFLPSLSDHCSIAIKLRTQYISNQFQSENYEFIEKPKKIKWDKEIAVRFENILQLPDSKLFLFNFVKNGILNKQEGIDSATDFLATFIKNSAELAGKGENKIEYKSTQKSDKPNWKFKKKNTRKKYHQNWHDATCHSILKKLDIVPFF